MAEAGFETTSQTHARGGAISVAKKGAGDGRTTVQRGNTPRVHWGKKRTTNDACSLFFSFCFAPFHICLESVQVKKIGVGGGGLRGRVFFLESFFLGKGVIEGGEIAVSVFPMTVFIAPFRNIVMCMYTDVTFSGVAKKGGISSDLSARGDTC